ncbi:hypothetical protein [Sphingomonas sp. Leaf67]|uniref:head-tail joining protein n=1 Tax=Sphingomonas sp. Leaf67 TaxID=1736230 RepID=UPI0012E30407|nr:hypothetical protein [Sphingomonas sp. Leaf67]
MAIDAQYRAPGSVAADYWAGGGTLPPVPVRIIRSRPDRIERFAGFQIDVRTETFEVRRSEVAQPVIGDLIAVGDERFEVLIEPQIDVEGLSWIMLAEPRA